MSKSSEYSTEALFKAVRGLLNSLPTKAEKSELLEVLVETRRFLEELEHLVDSIPTMESSQELSQGISRLDALTAQAHQHTGLRRLLGLRGQSANVSRQALSETHINERVNHLQGIIANSHEVSDVNIEDELAGESMVVLKQLASQLSVHVLSKERKSELARKIATHVRNQRGYARLRGNDR